MRPPRLNDRQRATLALFVDNPRCEYSILDVANAVRDGDPARLGFAQNDLLRFVNRGWLTARWEEPAAVSDSDRPRRRLYRLNPECSTVVDVLAHAEARAEVRARRPSLPRRALAVLGVRV